MMAALNDMDWALLGGSRLLDWEEIEEILPSYADALATYNFCMEQAIQFELELGEVGVRTPRLLRPGSLDCPGLSSNRLTRLLMASMGDNVQEDLIYRDCMNVGPCCSMEGGSHDFNSRR